jgi:hypothetical protein
VIDLLGFLRGKFEIPQPRGCSARGVLHEFHDQNPIDEVDRFGNPNARVLETMDHVDLGRSPGGLILLTTVAGALGHRPLVAGVARPPTFGVVGAMTEGALVRLLIDLRDALLAAGDDDVDLRLLPAHQGADHLLDHAIVQEGLETLGHLHLGLVLLMKRVDSPAFSSTDLPRSGATTSSRGGAARSPGERIPRSVAFP